MRRVAPAGQYAQRMVGSAGRGEQGTGCEPRSDLHELWRMQHLQQPPEHGS